MSISPEVQAARKKMQLARLKAKAEDLENYPEYYRNLPQQKVRAQKNAEWRNARRKLKEANIALEVAEVTGENLEAAQKEQQVAALVVERLKPSRAPNVAQLSGA